MRLFPQLLLHNDFHLQDYIGAVIQMRPLSLQFPNYRIQPQYCLEVEVHCK